jgi:hypothetical protein
MLCSGLPGTDYWLPQCDVTNPVGFVSSFVGTRSYLISFPAMAGGSQPFRKSLKA